MSKPKSIFIVDTPESINGEVPCKHCQMHVAEYDDYYHHYVCQSIRTNISADEWEIYKNCPLKPHQKAIPIEQLLSILPEYDDYIHLKTYPYNETMEDIYSKGYEDGWNVCLKIIKEELENWEKENENR